MTQRYVDVREHLPKLEIDKLTPLLLSRQKDQAIDRIMSVLPKLNGNAICLQKNDRTMAKVSVLSDGEIDNTLETKVRLSPDANIVESVAFETAFVKIQRMRAYDLNEDEQVASECMVKSVVETSTV